MTYMKTYEDPDYDEDGVLDQSVQDKPKTKIVKNLMTGLDVEIPEDTPWCCNPASETYWSM